MHISSISDASLVHAVRTGNDAAFSAIVRRYEPQLVGYARQVLGGAHHDAEEVVQDAFVRALNALRANDNEIALRAWLHAIVRNRALDQLRKPVRTADLETYEPVLKAIHADPASIVGRREDLNAMLAKLDELPERQRQALVLHEMQDESHSAIGRFLGVTRGGSKALVSRARAGLGRRAA